ncbi:transporter substrate-binding domain-containing protein [Ekhidna sp.]|uniref:transporter substrate-binding domain-containing protein n=1 Tax=Ekhidna sp. TaxID=2608089 RepID=UPI003B5A289E
MNLHFKTAALYLALMLTFASCKQSTSSQSSNDYPEREEFIVDLDLDKIKERGYITAIMDNSSTGLFVYKGKTMGYEYELLKMFCEEQGLQLRINITQNLGEAFNKLNTGEGDILAYNLTVTKERKKRIAFTHYHNLQRQVLIQRKPDNWRQMKLHEIEAQLIRNPVELIGKEVVVRPHSSYYDRMANLSEEIGGDILIVPGETNAETEQLIKQVAEGKIDYTVAEEDIALVNSTYYPNLDIKTPVSFSTQIAWGVRKNANKLLSELNDWIVRMRKTTDYYVIYDKYFKSSKSALRRSRSKYSTIRGKGAISPYDSLIQNAAEELEWDWMLLAAQIFRESKFDENAESWAGAVGLMQVLPRTGREYGVTNLYGPVENIYAGTRHLEWIQNYWMRKIEDENERMKFVLASYNVGLGHLQDAVRLTEKYGGNVKSWEDVSEFLLKKSRSKYFNDPVVEYGYCRGSEPVEYVDRILDIYQNYKEILQQESQLQAIAQ